MEKVFKALTIAGSDSGGGAGIQADLKTFQELGVYGMSAITAVTAQNTLGVQGVYPLTVEAVREQIQSIGDDMGTDAVKTGMLFSSELIKAVAEQIQKFEIANLVVDPVMIAKGGAPLLKTEAISALITYLIPLATVVTPNIPEAETLTGLKIDNLEDRKKAAKQIKDLGAKFVIIKGGHGEENESMDLLYDGEEYTQFVSKRVETKHTHGTGCTFAAAITAELAKGHDIREAVQTAKSFIEAAIINQLGIGNGHGPTNHWAYQLKKAMMTDGR
ncbi:bifunctional hydroxymethylpyrimidine kinase/phosphomethylpyrimidine kinase [Bacillus carboniphilus]|uniref:Hydroxymethylpyrimidine/phosphomethylpyrimidine kinase n=1 Tax=Bacillus carboniphilus TaxID=86663 RepID=A0ABN0VUJ4_9BACI